MKHDPIWPAVVQNGRARLEDDAGYRMWFAKAFGDGEEVEVGGSAPEAPSVLAGESVLVGRRHPHALPGARLAFAAEADAAILRLARTTAEFIVDDVWALMPESPTGVDNRAMGAAMQRAVKAGVIVASVRYRPSAQPQCHANPRRIWLSRRVSR